MDVTGTTLEGSGLEKFVRGPGAGAQNVIRVSAKTAGGEAAHIKLHDVALTIGRVDGGAVGGAGDAAEAGDPGYASYATVTGPGSVEVHYTVTDATAANIAVTVSVAGVPVTPTPVLVPVVTEYLGGSTFVRSIAVDKFPPHVGVTVSYDEKTLVVSHAPRSGVGAPCGGLHVYPLPDGVKVGQVDVVNNFKPNRCVFAYQSNTNILVLDQDIGRMLEYSTRGEQVRDFMDGGSRDMNCLAVADDMIAIGRKAKSVKQVTILSYSTGAVIASWGTGGSKIPDHAIIDAIAFTPDHKNLVVVDGAVRTYMLTVGGAFLRSIGTGVLTQVIPADGRRDVIVLPNGEVMLLDAGASRFVILDAETGYLSRTWGGPGAGEGQFTGPAALCARGSNLYVVENGPKTDRIQVFA